MKAVVAASKATAKHYVYKPLISNRGRFRLLRILSICENRLSISLNESQLSTDTQYYALSYTWGPPVNDLDADIERCYNEPIQIECDSRTVSISRNLFDALSNLAKTHPGVKIWADALCINQNDVEETRQQVAQMGDIYANAAKVVVWLGLDSFFPELEDFVWLQRADLHKHILELEKESEAIQRPGLNPMSPFISFFWGQKCPEDLDPGSRWQAYADFYTRGRWWYRAWVVQEVALAKDIEVYCGRTELVWNELRTLSDLVRKYGVILKRNIKITKQIENYLDLTEFGQAMFTMRSMCINGGPQAAVYSEPESPFVYSETKIQLRRFFAFIDNALCIVRPLKATVLQDKVYCIFGLFNRFLPEGLEPSIPDYKLSAESVYYSMVSGLIQNAPILSVLSSREDPVTTKLELPTWVPDYSVRNILTRHVKITSPRGLNKVYPYKDMSIWKNNADGSVLLQRSYISGNILKLGGTLIDTVAYKVPMPWACGGETTTRYIGGILRVCRNMKSEYLKDQTRLEIMSRTMTLDNDDFAHKQVNGYMSPLQMFLIYHIALASVNCERMDGSKPMLEINTMKWNPVHEAKMEMLKDLEYLAKTEPEEWYEINKFQEELAPALLTPSERKWMWINSKHDYPADTKSKAQGQSLRMAFAVLESQLSFRSIFLTSKGYVGLGMPSLEAGDELWALSGGLLGEAYLHGFMNGWDLMETEGMKGELIGIDLV